MHVALVLQVLPIVVELDRMIVEEVIDLQAADAEKATEIGIGPDTAAVILESDGLAPVLS